MWKYIVFCSLFAVTMAGVIHDSEPIEAETDHHHKIEHEHATSHQSFKIHHFHPVPVYVKHEDQHLLKNPVEVGGIKHKLKVLHPKSEHHHGHGLTLENHTEEKDHRIYDHYGVSETNQQYRTVENNQDDIIVGQPGPDLSHHQFQDINVHHGHEGHERYE